MQPHTSIPGVIKTIQSHYNYVACWMLLEKRGKEYFGPQFRLYEEDAITILQLLIYFLQDVPMAQKSKIDLNKG